MKHAIAAICLLNATALLHGQTPTITAVTGEDGAKFGLCPGGIAFVQGTNLGGQGAVVMVSGKRAYVNNGSQSSVQVELPVDATLGANTLTVGSSVPFNITLVQYAPGVATDGQPDNIINAFHPSQAAVTAADPAAPGEQIALIATGLGPTNPVYATGTAPSDTSAVTVATPTVTVGGKTATLVSSTLAPNSPGFYQVVFTVPPNLTTGNQNISVSVNGVVSGVAVLPVSTAPIVATVTNAASYNDPALPNGAIAQGSIFVIKGNNLGPATLTVAPSAFQSATLSGTSVNVTVAGTTVAALMYYTSVGQVAALLPSNTPVGTGTIAVSYGGQNGPAHPISVVASNVGIFTVTSDGQGAGIVTYADYSLVSTVKAANCGGVNTTCGAANPGDALIVWATGLGPVNGSDASGAGLGVNMTSLPLTIWLGGVQVAAVYQGRSGCCVGEDQIVFTVPANAPLGCGVPLTLQINSFVSNTVTMPVAAAGSRTCTPSDPALTMGSVNQITSGTGPFSYGTIKLVRNDNYPGFEDDLGGQFARFSIPAGMAPFFFSYADQPPFGTCQVYNNTNGLNTPLTALAGLDLGPQLTVQSANGNKVVTGGAGNYKGTLSATGNYLAPGPITVSAAGGADIPAFSVTYNLPAMPTMTSPQPDAPNPIAVTRANGLTVSWTGGASSVFIEIDGLANANNTGTVGASFTCMAPSSAGSFTIPANVLLAMPAGNFGGIYFAPTAPPLSIPGSSLSVGWINAQYNYWAPLNFK